MNIDELINKYESFVGKKKNYLKKKKQIIKQVKQLKKRKNNCKENQKKFYLKAIDKANNDLYALNIMYSYFKRKNT